MDELDEGPEDECGHQVVTVGGETQHHEIPDDGAGHVPDPGCGCTPTRTIAGESGDGHQFVVYEHVDQDV